MVVGAGGGSLVLVELEVGLVMNCILFMLSGRRVDRLGGNILFRVDRIDLRLVRGGKIRKNGLFKVGIEMGLREIKEEFWGFLCLRWGGRWGFGRYGGSSGGK